MRAIMRTLGSSTKALGSHPSFLGRERVIDMAEVTRVYPNRMTLKSGKQSKRLME